MSFALLFLLQIGAPSAGPRPAPPARAAQPEIIRTGHGVPHVYAADFREAGYGLAWVQLEDYGPRVVMGLVAAKGAMGRVFGRDSADGDFLRRPVLAHARSVWWSLEQPTRDVYDGFAAAVNDFLRAHPDRFAAGIVPDFTGWDVLAREIGGANLGAARRLVQRARGAAGQAGRGARGGDYEGPDDGSNAWALAPSRTRSGHAILLRNPHLAWDAGYYEGHLVIEGRLDFYGDFRVGSPFGVIGGFNHDLGWATTNNAVDNDEVYAVDLAPGLVDQILLDGRPIPLTRVPVTVEYRSGAAFVSETREAWTSPLGPVVDRVDGKAYLLKSAGQGEHRGGEQFLKMMRARSWNEWEAAMRLRARTTSNITYADRAGNIFYVWNGALPALPHPSGGDSTVIPATTAAGIWSSLVPWDSLPMVRNPPGGYVHNENSSPHFTNLRAVLDPARLPPNVEAPSLSLRSQLALELIARPGRKLALEDVLRLKNSYRMLLADRVKPDLLAASRAASAAALAEATGILEAWDNTTAPDARGAVLFETWWRLYTRGRARPFAEAWAFEQPTTTPRGLADSAAAVAALAAAADTVRARWGRLDVAWGEVHRVRIGEHDLPVGGCHGNLGCFRVLWFQDDPDGRRRVQGGDGWVLAVEFGPIPRAYSVLAYGQSNDPESPWFGDQAPMFASGEFKAVPLTRGAVEQAAVRRYRAGPGG